MFKMGGHRLAGHKDNHSGLMNNQQMDEFRIKMDVDVGSEWEPLCTMQKKDRGSVSAFLKDVSFFSKGPRRYNAARIEVPAPAFLDVNVLSTQAGFGKILDPIAKNGGDLADRIVTTSPDVTVSTNLGPWVNRRGIFARDAVADIVIAYQGCVAPEAIEAAGRIMCDRRDIGVLAVTSADRLNAGWTAAKRARHRGMIHAESYVERLMTQLPSHCVIVTVIDGHPLTLSWLGSVAGHKVVPLGVEHFGQTGTIADLYNHFSIDADAIVDAVEQLSPGKPLRFRAV